MSAASEPTTGVAESGESDSGRDGRGRFRKGNKGGPGNPFNRQVARMRQVLLESVSEDDLRAIVAEVVDQAKDGDLGAAKLVLAYVVGRPVPAVDPDRLDIEEIQVYQEEVTTAEQMTNPIEGMPAGLACEMLRGMMPTLNEEKRRQALEMVNE